VCTGTPVRSLSNRSKPFSKEPPPVRLKPVSMISAISSGGVASNVPFTASTILPNRSLKASLTASEEMVIRFGKPVSRSRPVTSICIFSMGYAEPIFIFIISAVRSPMNRLYSLLTNSIILSVKASPATGTDFPMKPNHPKTQ